jgi:hypothetical protein
MLKYSKFLSSKRNSSTLDQLLNPNPEQSKSKKIFTQIDSDVFKKINLMNITKPQTNNKLSAQQFQ